MTFAPGVTSTTFSVTLVDDDLHEEAEVFTTTLSDPVNTTLETAEAEGRIADDDPMPRVRLAVAAPAGGVVAEGVGATVVTLTGRLEGAARSTPTAMELSVTGVTADATDFAEVPAFTLTIPARTTVAAAAFTLTPVDDSDLEPDETVTVGSSTAGVVVIPATVTIAADDDVTAPSLSGATVEDAALVLTYDEALDEDSVPVAGDFAVRVTGTARGVDAVGIEGARVTLTLASAVANGATVTVSYTVPGTDPIQDLAGNDAAALTNYTAAASTPPVVRAVALVSIPTGGAYGLGEKIKVRVTFSEAVTVTGQLLVKLDVGGTERDALHVAGESSGAELVFAYAVAAAESDVDGVGIVADSLATPGGATIVDDVSNPAVLGHARPRRASLPPGGRGGRGACEHGGAGGGAGAHL